MFASDLRLVDWFTPAAAPHSQDKHKTVFAPTSNRKK
jgi:hypothetical protein